jgi:hypothetical protein
VIDQIWFARNQLIHKNVIPDIAKTFLLGRISAFGLSFWHPPPSRVLKLNLDVATKDGFVVTAAVLSNDKCDSLFAFTKKPPSLDVNKGEAMAALTGVDL